MKIKQTIIAIAGLMLAGCADTSHLYGDYIPRQTIQAPYESEYPMSYTIYSKDGDHHRFHTDVLINGVPINCLVDTGASAGIYLDKTTSIKAGLDRVGLTFGWVVSKVTGEYQSDIANVHEISWGGFAHMDIQAHVMISDASTENGHPSCILGMEYLRFFDIRIKGNEMRITR